jgi:ADP-heptose:LPS heptosyltransferase
MQILKNVAKELAYTPSRILCYIGGRVPLSQKKVDLEEIKNVLVVYSGGSKIGDVVLSTAAVRALRERFPSGYIAMLVNTITEDVVRHNPRLDDVFITKHFNFKRFLTLFMVPFLRKKKFDIVILLDPPFTYRLLAFLVGAKYRVGYDYKGNGFLLTNRVPYHQEQPMDWYFGEEYIKILRAVGINSDTVWPEIFVPDEMGKEAMGVLLENGIQKDDLTICIHPGSGGEIKELKRWPNENFAKICDMLIEKYSAKIILLSGPGESHLVKEIISMMKNDAVDLSGKTDSILKLAGVVKNCNVLLCQDSAPMHVSAAVGTPTVSLFGPTKPVMWAPVGKIHSFVIADVDCGPCYDAYPRVFKGCSDNRCMKLITPERVLDVIGEKIQRE